MQISLGNYIDYLRLDKIRELKGLTLYDRMEPCFNWTGFKESSGSIKNFIIARKPMFNNIGDCLIHYFALYFIEKDKLQLPKNFYERTYLIEELNFEKFNKTIDMYFTNLTSSFVRTKYFNIDSYLENLYNVNIQLNEFVNGYYVKSNDSNSYFISEHRNCFIIITEVEI